MSDIRPSEDSPIRPDAHRAHPYVQIGETDSEQTAPGPQHVAAVKAAHAIVGRLAERALRQPVVEAADQMPQRVAAESIAAEHDEIEREHDGSHADSELSVEPQRFPKIVRQDHQEQQREVKEVAMDVLDDERKRSLAQIFLARLADGA